MKKILSFLLISLVCAGDMLAQTVTEITKPIASSENSVVEVMFESDTISTFRFFHPIYGLSLTSEESIIDYVIERWGLTSNSSQEEIVDAFSLFNKTYELQINYSIIEGTTWHPKTPLGAYASLYSTQCGDHRLRTMHMIREGCYKLGVPVIIMQEVSWDGHQTFRYWSDVYTKWIHIDPDPGTRVHKVSDGNGGWASAVEIFLNPALMLLPENPIAYETLNSWDSDLTGAEIRIDFFENMSAVIDSTGDTSQILYYSQPHSQPEEREIFFRISEGVSIKMFREIEELYLLDTTGFDQQLFFDCAYAFEVTGDTAMQNFCIEQLAQLNGTTPEEMWTIITSDSIDITFTDTIIPKQLIGGEYIEVYIEDGSVLGSSNWHMPLFLRSIEPVNKGVDFEINGITHNDSSFNKIYLPTMSDANALQVTDSMMELISSISTPQGLGGLKLTFYVNGKTHDFTTGKLKLWVESGDIRVIQDTLVSDTTNITSNSNIGLAISTIFVFPNPTNGIINFSQPLSEDVVIYNITGERVALMKKGRIKIDLSTHPAGIYFIPALGEKVLKIE